MNLLTATLSLLILCSIVSPSTLKDARKGLNPSLFEENGEKQVIYDKDRNSLTITNEDGIIFTVDKNKQVGRGVDGTVYDAENHSDPNTPTVMKVTTSHFSNRRKVKAKADQENQYNEIMGISAGKPVVISDGLQTTAYLPMIRIDGATLKKELHKGREDASYISTHTLLQHARTAIDETKNKGISHNDAHAGNIMVTAEKGKMIDYGYEFIL